MAQQGRCCCLKQRTNTIESFKVQAEAGDSARNPALLFLTKVDPVLTGKRGGGVCPLGQVKPVLAAKKRVFTDTLLAASLEDVRVDRTSGPEGGSALVCLVELRS